MKDKTTAAIFALFLGWLGIHRFYLRQPGLGVLYLILMFFGISVVLGIIDAIVLLAMDPAEFDRRYNEEKDGRARPDYQPKTRRYQRRSEQREYRYQSRGRQGQSQQRQQQRQPRYRRPSASRTTGRNQIPRRERHNPYKQTGIKKYKDFDLEGAIEDFVKGLEISPKDVSLHFNIACAYSLTEQAEKAYYHIDKAVAFGLKDIEKIKTHDDLAYIRIQEEFDAFAENGFRLVANAGTPMLEPPKENLLDDDVLLSQLKRLAELREKGLLTEEEFATEKKKLMGS